MDIGEPTKDFFLQNELNKKKRGLDVLLSPDNRGLKRQRLAQEEYTIATPVLDVSQETPIDEDISIEMNNSDAQPLDTNPVPYSCRLFPKIPPFSHLFQQKLSISTNSHEFELFRANFMRSIDNFQLTERERPPSPPSHQQNPYAPPIQTQNMNSSAQRRPSLASMPCRSPDHPTSGPPARPVQDQHLISVPSMLAPPSVRPSQVVLPPDVVEKHHHLPSYAYATSATPVNHNKHHVKDEAIPTFGCTFQGCTESFPSYSELTNHLKIHRPYKCPIEGCSASYVRSSDLTKHKRVHLSGKPYKVSNGSVPPSGDSKNSEKPLKCPAPGCNASYVRASDLTKHSRIHAGEKFSL